MSTGANVSLMPATASGLLCNSSPIAAAIAVSTTEADVHALAGVVRGKRSAVSLSAWAADLYGQEAPPPSGPAAVEEPPSTAAPATRTSFTSSPHQRVSLLLSNPSVDGAGSTTAAAGHLPSPATGDLSAPSLPTAAPAATTAAVAVSYRQRKNVSWQCTLCGYHVLAMDQDGTALPFSTSAYGNVLPLTCPRCKLTHTSWQTSTPFSEEGDHMNLPTTLSNRYVAPSAAQQVLRGRGRDAAPGPADPSAEGATDAAALLGGGRIAERAAAVAALATQQRHIPGMSTVAPVQRRAYYCGNCGRRLLRVDANGELVDMDRDKDGQVLPITCPGCRETHSDWVVKPYAVKR